MTTPLTVGARIQVHGGYDMEPRWLAGKERHFGRVVAFIQEQGETAAAVVELDEPISVDEVTGGHLILSLRHIGATWGLSETVHVELCDFVPGSVPRKQGKWVESHATYALLP